MNEMLEKILKELGFTESEVRTYVAALQRGPSAVSDLAACTNLTRQSIYNATTRLVECGLLAVDSRYGEGRAVYAATEPRRLLDCVHKKKQEFEDIGSRIEGLLPELEFAAGGEKPVIRVMEGFEGLRSAMAEIVRSGADGGYELVDFDRLGEVLTPEQLGELHQLAVGAKDRNVTGVYSHGVPEAMLKQLDHTVALSAEDSGFCSVVSAFKDKIVLGTFKGRMHIVIIEDESLAKAFRVMLRHTYEHAVERQSSLEKQVA